MKKTISREPPLGTPEGTVWFGGPVDRWQVGLRVYGEELDPDHISALLGCQPSSEFRKGDPFPRKGRWLWNIDTEERAEKGDVEDGIKLLLARLPSDPGIWVSLTSNYAGRLLWLFPGDVQPGIRNLGRGHQIVVGSKSRDRI
jgi:hypothetical protein